MKHLLLLILLFVFTCVCAQKYNPVKAPKQDVKDIYHGYTINDPYRWLEDVNTEQTQEWVKEQEKMSSRYLLKASNKTSSYERINEFAYTKYDMPAKIGSYYFTFGRYNDASTPAVFYRKALKDNYSVVVDPSSISKSDNIEIRSLQLSDNEKYLAYTFSRDGSDQLEVKVVNMNTTWATKDHLKGLKYTSVQWKGNGFYYLAVGQTSEFGQIVRQEIRYHTLGTPQEEDEIIFARKDGKLRDFSFKTTHDEQFFIIKERILEDGRLNFFYIDFRSEKAYLKPLIMKSPFDLNIRDSKDGKLIATTTMDEKGSSIIAIDPALPRKWTTLVPAFEEAVRLSLKVMDKGIVAIYQSNHCPVFMVYDFEGKELYSKAYSMGSAIGNLSADYADDELMFSYASYATPSIVYTLNMNTFEVKPYKNSTINFTSNDIHQKSFSYHSFDSTLVSMLLIYEGELKTDSSAPVLIKAYGGFGSVTTASFDPGMIHFIKKGGVFAFVNIRGGGDKGPRWAVDGRGMNKQNSIHDFISAAETLIDMGLTAPGKVAINGGSNGGLVVASAAMQRPDLFGAVVAEMAPLDMLRFENFTVGAFHHNEYGSVKDSLSFLNLKSYSPLHLIREDVNYPAMLIVTADRDDRVPPFHSYKFVAALQNRKAQTHPILLKVISDAGHHGASTASGNIKEMSDIYSFVLYETTKEK